MDQAHGGLLVIRGLKALTPTQLLALSAVFGSVERRLDDSKRQYTADGVEGVMRLGNVRDHAGRLVALNALSEMLPCDGSPQYRPRERQPVWHTDSVYRRQPPIGSALFCKQAPPDGGCHHKNHICHTVMYAYVSYVMSVSHETAHILCA